MLHVGCQLVDLAHGVGAAGVGIDGLGVADALHGGGQCLERAALGVAHEGYEATCGGVGADGQRFERQLGHADEGEVLFGIHVDDGAGPGAAAGVLHDRGGHAGDHVGVGDDQAVVRHEAGAGGGVAALLCGTQNLNDGGSRPVQCRGFYGLGGGAGFGGDELADFRNGSEGEHVIAYRVDAVLDDLGGGGDHPGEGLGFAERSVELRDGYGAHGDGQHYHDQGAGGEVQHAAEEAFNALERGDVSDAADGAPGKDTEPLSDGQADDEHTDGGNEAPLGSHGCHGEGHEPGCGADAQTQAEEGSEGGEESAADSGEEVEQQNDGDSNIKQVDASRHD